jgi:DNA-binding NtrC family response regulator
MSTQALETVPAEEPAAPTPRGLKELVEEYERALILKALADSGGHQRRAARALGVLPTTLNEKMRRLQIRAARASSRRQ